MEMAALIVSILAIVISIIVAIWQGIHENRINRTELESLYHQEIFKDYLISKIPDSRRYLKFKDDGRLDETNKLCNTLQEMVFSSLYFFYSDRAFYDGLSSACEELVDYLVQLSQQKLTKNNQDEAMEEIQSKIKAIYDHIGKKYLKG